MIFLIICKPACINRLIRSTVKYLSLRSSFCGFLYLILFNIVFILHKPPMQHIGISFSPTLITIGTRTVIPPGGNKRMGNFSCVKKCGTRCFVPSKDVRHLVIGSRTTNFNLSFFCILRRRYSMYPFYRYNRVLIPFLDDFYLQILTRSFNIFMCTRIFKFDICIPVPHGFIFLKVQVYRICACICIVFTNRGHPFFSAANNFRGIRKLTVGRFYRKGDISFITFTQDGQCFYVRRCFYAN